jgi:hypothetical protein
VISDLKLDWSDPLCIFRAIETNRLTPWRFMGLRLPASLTWRRLRQILPAGLSLFFSPVPASKLAWHMLE